MKVYGSKLKEHGEDGEVSRGFSSKPLLAICYDKLRKEMLQGMRYELRCRIGWVWPVMLGYGMGVEANIIFWSLSNKLLLVGVGI